MKLGKDISDEMESKFGLKSHPTNPLKDGTRASKDTHKKLPIVDIGSVGNSMQNRIEVFKKTPK